MLNIEKQPFLGYMSPSGKFWILMLLFMLSLIIFSLLAAIILIPFSGMESIDDFGKIGDLNNPSVIIGLKIAQTISAVGTFILPAFVFTKLISNSPASYLKITKWPSVKSLLIVTILMTIALPLINWMAEWNSKMVLPEFLSAIERWMKAAEDDAKKLTEAFLKMDDLFDLFVNLFVVALLAAFSEELLFRGVIQKLLFDWTKNKHLAIWIGAIIFSAFHVQFYGFIPRMVLGAMLGYLFMWSGSLWLPVFAHFLNNGIAVVFQYLIIKDVVSKEIETIGENSNPIYLLPTLLTAFVLLFLLYKTEKKSIEDC